MSEKYEHEGRHFTKQIAAELIFKTYVVEPSVDETNLPEKVYQIHEAGGGLPPKLRYPNPATVKAINFTIRSYVRGALSGLKNNGCATQESFGLWRIHNIDIHRDELTYPKTLGKGSQTVYLYYYRTYREAAVLKKISPVWKINIGKILWHCRIGETHKQEAEARVKQQMGVPPEPPIIALKMKTNDSKKLEKMIHEILQYWSRQAENAQGREWFLTSPQEVESIYNFLL